MNNHDVSDLKETTVIPISSIVHTVTIDQLIEETSKYNLPEESQAKIRQAYELSAKAHEGQFRRSGESYVEHPLNVAWILASMKVDATCLITALLHDTLEDTTLSSEQIESLFGSKVVSLIDGVTKIGKFHFQATKAEKQAENFRKMLLSM